MAIAEMPLTLKLAKMRQENQQKSETTTDFTSLGKNKIFQFMKSL